MKWRRINKYLPAAPWYKREMIEALYTREILRLASTAPSGSELAGADISVTKTSRICGSRITIGVKFNDGKVCDYTQEIKACALGQASSAIVAQHVVGKTWQELAPVADQVEALLREGGSPPEGEWADYKAFVPARDHPARHSAIMLPFEALREAFTLRAKKSAS